MLISFNTCYVLAQLKLKHYFTVQINRMESKIEIMYDIRFMVSSRTLFDYAARNISEFSVVKRGNGPERVSVFRGNAHSPRIALDDGVANRLTSSLNPP